MRHCHVSARCRSFSRKAGGGGGGRTPPTSELPAQSRLRAHRPPPLHVLNLVNEQPFSFFDLTYGDVEASTRLSERGGALSAAQRDGAVSDYQPCAEEAPAHSAWLWK